MANLGYHQFALHIFPPNKCVADVDRTPRKPALPDLGSIDALNAHFCSSILVLLFRTGSVLTFNADFVGKRIVAVVALVTDFALVNWD